MEFELRKINEKKNIPEVPSAKNNYSKSIPLETPPHTVQGPLACKLM
jgi:hypothetical protein